jgi:chemotaxis protein CheZ
MDDIGKILFERMQEMRSDNNRKIEMTDIDGIISTVMETIKGYVTSQSDISIFNEIEKISKQIKQAKDEVRDLNPQSIGENFIPGATSELGEITKATEASTNTILDAAEAIQSLANKVADSQVKQEINNKVIEIFEACNFQDITGQRITKVTKILEDIDSTINSIINAFSSTKEPTNKKTTALSEKNLLNGPQLATEAPSQSQIDDLFNNLDNKK